MHAPMKEGDIRSQDGAQSPFFEGITPPKRMDPKKWRSYERHSMNPVKTPDNQPISVIHCWGEIPK